MARVTVLNDSSPFLDLMHELVGSLGHDMVGFKAVDAPIEDIVDSRPDLLVVDLRLEDPRQTVSGWELLLLARSHHQLVSVPVILYTADVWELEKRAADLELIADVHVRTKPFKVEDMCAISSPGSCVRRTEWRRAPPRGGYL
jgi:DNA-binding response OmpR family regulator